MATLDISITNAALPTIQGEIGAVTTEGTWIGTSYLVAEIIATPLTAWLARMIGLRRFLMAASIAFMAFSALCGLASDLPTMIIGRVGQGLAGGTLVPVALTIIATRLPAERQSFGISIFGAAVLLGPLLGPMVGGWIAERYSWRFIFFINLPACVAMLAFIMAGIERTPARWVELRNADWAGIFGLSIGLGSLTVLLEEGHRELWFESNLIVTLGGVAALGFAIFVYGQLKAAKPILNLSILRNRNLSLSIILQVMFGGLMFCTQYLVPQFLSAVAGYNALQAGQIASLSGITSTVILLFFPWLTMKVGPKKLVILGMPILASSAFWVSGLTTDSNGDIFIVSQLLFGLGSAGGAFSLQQLAISAVRVEQADESSSLFMTARNLGGSIGLAIIATIQDQRFDFHHWQLHYALAANDPIVQDYMAGSSALLGDGADGMGQALALLDQQVSLQALVMAYNDIFLMLGCAVLAVIPLAFLLKNTKAEVSKAALH